MPIEKSKLNPNRPPIHSFEKKDSNFKMAWNREFREMLREHPGIIKMVIELTKKAEDEYAPDDIKFGFVTARYNKETEKWGIVAWDNKPYNKPQPLVYGRGTLLKAGNPVVDEQAGLEVILLGKSNRELKLSEGPFTRVDKTNYFKMNLKGQTFFVKKTLIGTNPGFTEFRDTVSAKKALTGLDFVKVIEPKLGFQDKNQSWYVSEWQELESAGFASYDQMMVGGINDYGNYVYKLYSEENISKYEEAEKRIEKIEAALEQVGIYTGDLDPNLFYNLTTDTFILLDIGKDEEGIGKPVRIL